MAFTKLKLLAGVLAVGLLASGVGCGTAAPTPTPESTPIPTPEPTIEILTLQSLIREIGEAAGFEFEPNTTDRMATAVRWNTSEGELFLEGKGYSFGDNLGSKLVDEQFQKANSLLKEKGFDTDELNTGLSTELIDLRRYRKDNIICNLKKMDIERKGSTEILIACADLEKELFTEELTLTEIKNTQYYVSAYKETVQLENGHYEKEDPQKASALAVNIYRDHEGQMKIASGDLNGDNKEDAAVVLASSAGGSGYFRELAVMINRDGKPSYLTSKMLGDRIIIDSVSIESGVVTLDMRVHGPQDPLCCPTLKTIVKLKLTGSQLVAAQGNTP